MKSEERVAWHASWLLHLLAFVTLSVTASAAFLPPRVAIERGVITLHASLAPEAAEEAVANLHVHAPGMPQDHHHADTPLTIHSHPRATRDPVHHHEDEVELPVRESAHAVPMRVATKKTTDTEPPSATPAASASSSASPSVPRTGTAHPTPRTQTSAAAPPRPSAPGAADQPPQRLPTNPAPPSPDEAHRLGQQGRVLLEVQLDERGQVTSIRVAESSGFAALDRSALNTVRNWSFRPALRNGTPIAFTLRVPIRFAIRDN